MIRNILPASAILICLLCTSCSSDKTEQKAPSGKFMQNDSTRTDNSKNYFARERERRREYDREFKDVRYPMNQDHFRVIPWHEKHYTPRSEKLHESSREPANSIFSF